MPKLRASRINEKVLVLVVCVGASALGFAFGKSHTVTAEAPRAIPQRSDEKSIERKEFPSEPFQFGDLSVKNVKIAPSRRFNAKSLAEKAGGSVEDWLENLAFTIKNSSPKRMTYINVELDFPETTSNGPMMVYNQLGIGIHPKALRDRVKNGVPFALGTGDKTTFSFSAEHMRLLKEFLALRNFRLADLSQVTIRIDYVIFEDGMRWSQGDNYKPNPAVPGGYERINPSTQWPR